VKLLLLLFTGLKLSKLLFSAGSMVLALAVYASLYGWPYAAGFIFMLLVHEMGHYLVARQHGLNVGLPTFIPFVGAWIELKEQPMNVQVEAKVAYAGPFAGSLAAFAAYFWARENGSQLMLAVAYSGFLLNRFRRWMAGGSSPSSRRASGCWVCRCWPPSPISAPARCCW